MELEHKEICKKIANAARKELEAAALKQIKGQGHDVDYYKKSGAYRLIIGDDEKSFLTVFDDNSGMLELHYTDEALYDHGYSQDEDGTLHFVLPPRAEFIQLFYIDKTMAEALLPILMKLVGPLSSIVAALNGETEE